MSNASVEDTEEVKEEQQEEMKEEGGETKIEDKEEGETANAGSAPIAPAPQAIQPVVGGVPPNPFAPYPAYPYPFPGGGPFADYSQQHQSQSVNYVDASHLPDPPPDTRRNRGGVTEPFPEKMHRMLEHAEMVGKADVVSFFPHGRAFAIHKPRRFVTEIMSKYFRQSRMTSFQRQLNLYGFRRISQGPDNGGYYHELFLKGRPGLCINMKRTKVKGTSKLKRDPESEPNFYVMRGVGPIASMGVPIVPPAALEGNSSVTPTAEDAVETTGTPGEDTTPAGTEPASAPESAAPVPAAIAPVLPAGVPPGYPYAYPYPPYHLPPHMMPPPYTVAQSPLSGDGSTPSQTPGAPGQPIAMYPPYGPPPPYPYAAYYTPWGVPVPPYAPGVSPAVVPVAAAPTAETASTEEDVKKSEELLAPSPESDPAETAPAENAPAETTSAENTASV
eukprot:scaffold53803_cov52-Attheya_sp.AAC.2